MGWSPAMGAVGPACARITASPVGLGAREPDAAPCFSAGASRPLVSRECNGQDSRAAQVECEMGVNPE